MKREYRQIVWDESVEADARELIRLALREDLGEIGDLTVASLNSTTSASDPSRAASRFVARQSMIVAGLPAAKLVFETMGVKFQWEPHVEEGRAVDCGTALATISGRAADLLVGERTALNLLSRLCGVATLTRQYVDAAAGTSARIYDTRKTTPGWRRLEKYAVRQGGGCNHRMGLYDSILIKDNHLAVLKGVRTIDRDREDPDAVRDALAEAHRYVRESMPKRPDGLLIEIEVDDLSQLEAALRHESIRPDVVLLDNMDDETLRHAVAMRNEQAPDVELEASGGMTLDRIPSAARTGVDRISVGALTHQAVSLDVGLDWIER